MAHNSLVRSKTITNNTSGNGRGDDDGENANNEMAEDILAIVNYFVAKNNMDSGQQETEDKEKNMKNKRKSVNEDKEELKEKKKKKKEISDNNQQQQ